MKSKLLRKTLGWIAVFLGLYLLVGLILNFYMASYLQWQEEDIATLHELQTMLEQPHTQFQAPTSILNVPELVITANRWEAELGQITKLHAEVENIKGEFIVKLNEYFTEVDQYVPSGKVFPDFDADSVPFAQRRNSDVLMSELKSEFRSYLIAQNEAGENILRFELDPEAQLSQMTTADKVWQLFVPTILGPTLNSQEKDLLEAYRPGGIVLLGANVDEENQTKQLTKSLQLTNPKEPLLIMTDQEGGLVKRVWWDSLPSQKQMGNYSLEEQCKYYNQRDELLWNLGINFNLGIVADVTGDTSSFIYSRVFSGDFAKTAEQVKNALECTNKTINTLKHFPGHGATTADTHQGLATINLGKEEWENSHLLPFAGITQLEESKQAGSAIMTGHLILNALDSENPTSLSEKVISYLRQDLGYSGLIITDDMRMLDSAGKERKQSAKQALLAGNDILLYSASFAEVVDIAVYLHDQVESGEISTGVLDSAVQNILKAKNYLISQEETYVPLHLVW